MKHVGLRVLAWQKFQMSMPGHKNSDYQEIKLTLLMTAYCTEK